MTLLDSENLTAGTARLRIRLVKTSGVLGPLAVGTQFEKLYDLGTSSIDTRDMAVQRTYRMLKREHPDENPMCWTVEGA